MFTNANTADTPTLNVESTGAKAIYNEAGVAVSATSPAYLYIIIRSERKNIYNCNGEHLYGRQAETQAMVGII